MDSLRNIFQSGGGNILPGRESPNLTRCTLIPEELRSWKLVDDGDDRSAPRGGLATRGGECNLTSRDLTRFTLGDPGTVQNAPAKVTQQWGDAMDPRTRDTEGGGTTPAPPGQATQAMTTFLTPPYSGMSAAIQRWGTGDTVSQG